jgi:hypothetical protein
MKQTGLYLQGANMRDLHAPVAVVGANGHTGRFVVRELQRRGLPVVAVVRDAAKAPPGVPARVAGADDAAALDRAFAGCSVVINCAGPFLDSADAVAAAAVRAGCSYLDVTAEQASAQATFDEHDAAARAAGVAVIPAAGFYGGLADLLASALAGGEPLDEVAVAVALDHWWPTAGTRITGVRNQVPRIVIEDGRRVAMALPAARSTWTFPGPEGATEMVELPFSEVVTISRHLRVRRLHAHLNARSLDELRDAATPPPSAVDAQGRSAQRFTMEVRVRDHAGTRSALARGQDIYAVTAPIVVEAAARLRAPSFEGRGALALGQAFDPGDFLRALAPAHLELAFGPGRD